MPFRLWFYAAKLGFPLLLLACVAAQLFDKWIAVSKAILHTATGMMVGLCLTGAVLGILMAMGRLRMRCPFCGRSGDAGGNSRLGMFMICERCGLVRGGGLLNMRIVREELPADEGHGDSQTPASEEHRAGSR